MLGQDLFGSLPGHGAPQACGSGLQLGRLGPSAAAFRTKSSAAFRAIQAARPHHRQFPIRIRTE